MDFLIKDQKIRVIPLDIKGIAEGLILEADLNSFTVIFKNIDAGFFDNNLSPEIILPTDKCVITFNSTIISLDNNKVAFTLPENVKYIQRREYTRIDLNIPVELKEFIEPESESINSFSKNISGGGMQIATSSDFDAGSLLEAEFNILGNKTIKAVLEVLRIDENELSKEYLLSGSFNQISNADRTAIIHLCFKKQLEQRCKNI